MAVNKNFVVKNGLEVNTQLIFADSTNNKVGIASTQPNVELDVRGGIAASNTTVSGVSTIQTALRVGSGIAGTIFTALDSNVVGIGTSIPVFLLDVRDPTNGGIGTVFNVMGDSLLDHLSADSLKISGISTFDRYANFRDGFEVTIGVGTFANLHAVGLSTFNHYVDIAADVGITSTLVVGAGLSVVGVSTLTGLTDLNGGLDVTGIATFANNLDINADVDINRSITVTGGSEVTGVSTFTGLVDVNGGIDITGVSTFSNNLDINADVDLERSLVVVGGIGVTGIGTINAVKIFNDGNIGIITANDPSGIVTYYGDGQFLTNIQSGVGIATTNPSTGYSEIVGLGATIITFAGPGVSTNASHAGGTGVTVNAASGIATVYLQGGGSGSGAETTIVRDSTTVSGTQSVFTSSSPYTSGYIDIFINGIKQNASDFTETDSVAGTVTLSTAAVDGDIVELVNYEVVAITGEVETLITKEEFTVTTASRSVFDLARSYTTGYIDVYLNGVRLTGSDYTETDSDTVTLTTAATYGDIVEFVSFEKRAISELKPIWRNDSVGSGSGGIYTFTSVGVGTSEQTAFFEVYGPSKFRTGVVTFTNSGDTDIVRITDGGFNIISGITTIGGTLDCNGNLDVDGTDHDIVGTTALDNVWVSAGATIQGNLTVTGAGSTSSIAGALQLTNVNVSGVHTSSFSVVTNDLTVNGNLNVNGTTTVLDTLVQEVDLLNIQANSSTPGLGVTQSGTGDIIRLYDNTITVFKVADGGDVYIGKDNSDSTTQVQIGGGPSGDRTSYIDLIGDTTYTDYGGRFIRYGGANAITQIDHRGTGKLQFRAREAGSSVVLTVETTDRLTVTGAGATVTGICTATSFEQSDGAKLATTGKAIAMAMVFG